MTLKIERAIDYNKKSAERRGWEPVWFGHDAIDETLYNKIWEFQDRKGLTRDGKVGKNTFRSIVAERQANENDEPDEVLKGKDYIVCDGKKVPIDANVVSFDENHKISFAHQKKRTYSKRKPGRKIGAIITHWDVTKGPISTFKVLRAVGLSSHFCIAVDGTIYQYADTKDITRHCGRLNSWTIGIDINSRVYAKYSDWYEQKGHGKRPLMVAKYHKRKKEILGYYPAQIEAYNKLIRVLCDFYDIPREAPVDEDGKLITTVYPELKKKKWEGVANHYNLTRKKWDTAGFLESCLDDDPDLFPNVKEW